MIDFKLAAVSMHSIPVSPEINIKKHAFWAEKAADKGADVCCFPEISTTGACYDYGKVFAASESLCGNTTQRMIELSAKHNMMIGYGIHIKDEKDLVYNTYVLVSKNGVLGHYNKVHIPVPEYAYQTPGTDFTVIDTGFARMGVNTCFDCWFSEAARMSYLNGAEVILAPFRMSMPGDTYRQCFDNWKKLAMINFPAAAWQNGVYHITINSRADASDSLDGPTPSPSVVFIFNPQGELEAQSDPDKPDDQMVVHTLRGEALKSRRSQEHFHPKYRKPYLYKKMTE